MTHHQQKTLVSIVGPTAVGKSAGAEMIATEILKLNAYQGVDIVAVDSRQVYTGLEIVSGADIPTDASSKKTDEYEYSYWERDLIRWHGLSCIPATAEWSVAHFQDLFLNVWKNALAQNRFVILVGGTGLYHDWSLVHDVKLQVPPDLALREQAQDWSLEEFQRQVQKIAPSRWSTMNKSDRANPRRLIRVLEQAAAQQAVLPTRTKSDFPILNHYYLGLTDDIEAIASRIEARVGQRWEQGALKEVEKVLALVDQQTLPILTATGVKEISAYLIGTIDQETSMKLWVTRELQYAKRQYTWWKKRSDVSWFQVSQPDWQSRVWQHVEKLLY